MFKPSKTIAQILSEPNTGYIDVNYTVSGYWSDVVSVAAIRGLPGEWEIRVRHSSGGRSGGMEDYEAEYNFAMAVLDACKLARELKTRVKELEDMYE